VVRMVGTMCNQLHYLVMLPLCEMTEASCLSCTLEPCTTCMVRSHQAPRGLRGTYPQQQRSLCYVLSCQHAVSPVACKGSREGALWSALFQQLGQRRACTTLLPCRTGKSTQEAGTPTICCLPGAAAVCIHAHGAAR
jgi:hypothetical protein